MMGKRKKNVYEKGEEKLGNRGDRKMGMMEMTGKRRESKRERARDKKTKKKVKKKKK